MNVIFLIPTGLGAPIGGHAGDATPAARLVGAACTTLIVHPNVVNAADINEMPSNSWYVTGATIDDLMQGYIGLAPVHANRVAVLVNRPVPAEVVNLVSAARASFGMEAFVVGLPHELIMKAHFTSEGAASGTIEGADLAIEHLENLGEVFDAVAILTRVQVSEDDFFNYVQKAEVNPWGGVEARLSRIMTDALKVPCAHAPFGHTVVDFNEIVDPRLAAEMISETYGFCILKGLHKAPMIVDKNNGMNVDHIQALVTPEGCYGVSHIECVKRDIPIISVVENTVLIRNDTPYPRTQVHNYMEAAGAILALKEGIFMESLRRPLLPTKIFD
ncbi:MAG TPA: DUF3326 domain-containing protein [bacterium]|nr:DUF3326 domain-containing protein [bacterium]